MSVRSIRLKNRIDYKIYNETGKKIQREPNFEKMSELIDQELKLVKKIVRFRSEYNLDLLFDINEIEEAISEQRKLLEAYEELHIKLKRDLAEDYSNTYIDYDGHIKIMTDYIILAKKEIRNKKLVDDSKITDKLKTEEKCLRETIREIGSMLSIVVI